MPWASLDAQDGRSRFVDLLLFALRAATGREAFATLAARSRLDAGGELDTLTTLLAEVANVAKPTVVVLDDAHRMTTERFDRRYSGQERTVRRERMVTCRHS